MVLEDLIDPCSAERNPAKIALLTAVFVSIAVIATLFLGQDSPGWLLIVLVLLPSIPFVLNLINYQEEKTTKMARKKFFGSHTLARHFSTLMILFVYFIALTATFTFWYLALPSETSDNLFAIQTNELRNVQGSFYGYATNFLNTFETIFLHNLEVLLLLLLFSLLYGAGSVFILVWNASVVAVFLGGITRAYLLQSPRSAAWVTGLGTGVLGILPHGLFELFAYLGIALAGGVLSRAILRHMAKKPEFIQVLYDVAKLTGWSILFLALGAFIESTGAIA